jgi:hypothetical protein
MWGSITFSVLVTIFCVAWIFWGSYSNCLNQNGFSSTRPFRKIVDSFEWKEIEAIGLHGTWPNRMVVFRLRDWSPKLSNGAQFARMLSGWHGGYQLMEMSPSSLAALMEDLRHRYSETN